MDSDFGTFEIPGDASDSATPAPKRTRRASRAPKEVASSVEIRDLIEAMYGGIAKIPNQEHWEITKDEAGSIANPLSRVLARQGPTSRWLADHADTLLLAFTACAVTLPRVYISVNGGNKPSDGTPVRSPVEHTGSIAVNRLLFDEPIGARQDAVRVNGSSNGTQGAEVGDVDSLTADAIRDAFRDLPQ